MINIKNLTDSELKEFITQAISEQEDRRAKKRYQAMLNIRNAVAEYNQQFGELWIEGIDKAPCFSLIARNMSLNAEKECINIITD